MSARSANNRSKIHNSPSSSCSSATETAPPCSLLCAFASTPLILNRNTPQPCKSPKLFFIMSKYFSTSLMFSYSTDESFVQQHRTPPQRCHLVILHWLGATHRRGPHQCWHIIQDLDLYSFTFSEGRTVHNI